MHTDAKETVSWTWVDADRIWRERKKSDSRGQNTREIRDFHTEALSCVCKDMHVDTMLCGQRGKQISGAKIRNHESCRC